MRRHHGVRLRRSGVAFLTTLLLVGHGLAHGGSWDVEAVAVPGAPLGGLEAAAEGTGGDPDAHRIGDWTLMDGRRLVTGAGDGSLVIACGGGGNGVVVEMTLAGGAAATYDVRLAAAAVSVVLAGRLTPGGRIAFDDDAEDRLLALLAKHVELSVTLLPRAAGSDEIAFRLGTAGFEAAFDALGCGASDSCPVRSCGR